MVRSTAAASTPKQIKQSASRHIAPPLAFPGNAFMEKAPVILPPSREKTLHLGYRANYRLKCPCRCLTGRLEFASF